VEQEMKEIRTIGSNNLSMNDTKVKMFNNLSLTNLKKNESSLMRA
jgi:hypothetical protein